MAKLQRERERDCLPSTSLYPPITIMTASAEKDRPTACVCVCVYISGPEPVLSVYLCPTPPLTQIYRDVCDLSSLTDSYVSLSVKVCFFFHSINLSPVPFVDLFAPEGGCLLKGTEKRKSFYFLCAHHVHEKVKLGTSCELNSRLQSPPPVCQTPAYFQQPFTHLSLLLSSCLFRSLLHFLSILHPPPPHFHLALLLSFGFCHFLSTHTFPLSLHSLIRSEDSFIALMLLFHSSGDFKSKWNQNWPYWHS